MTNSLTLVSAPVSPPHVVRDLETPPRCARSRNRTRDRPTLVVCSPTTCVARVEISDEGKGCGAERPQEGKVKVISSILQGGDSTGDVANYISRKAPQIHRNRSRSRTSNAERCSIELDGATPKRNCRPSALRRQRQSNEKAVGKTVRPHVSFAEDAIEMVTIATTPSWYCELWESEAAMSPEPWEYKAMKASRLKALTERDQAIHEESILLEKECDELQCEYDKLSAKIKAASLKSLVERERECCDIQGEYNNILAKRARWKHRNDELKVEQQRLENELKAMRQIRNRKGDKTQGKNSSRRSFRACAYAVF